MLPESLAPFWKRIGSQPGLLHTTLYVAAGLSTAGTAAMLLEPSRVETVAPEHAGGLRRRPGSTAGSGRAGSSTGGSGRAHYFEADRYEWVARLPELCGALRAAEGHEVARLLAASTWGWASDQLRLWTTPAPAEIREPQLEMLSLPLVRLLEAADENLREEIVAALRGYANDVLGCLLPALRSAAVMPTAARRAARLDVVARDCEERLGAIIARPLRDEDDWSIGSTGCACDLCGDVGDVPGFPVAADLRVAAGDSRAPARAHPDRLGRAAGAAPDPAAAAAITLVLTKTDELFTREKDARRKAVTDLAWLTSAWADGPPGTS